MHYATDEKIVTVTPPGAIVDNASFTTASIDTRGYARATIYVLLGATDIAMAALKVAESDNDSDYTDVPGLNYATDGALPAADDDNSVFAFDIDLRGRKRYLDVIATAGDGSTGTYAAIIARLTRGSQGASDATDRGLAATLSA